MAMNELARRSGEEPQSSPVKLNLDHVEWDNVSIGAVVAKQVLRRAVPLRPEEYVTYLLANAYYYAKARMIGASHFEIPYGRKSHQKPSAEVVPVHIKSEEIIPFDMGHEMNVHIPHKAAILIPQELGGFEIALNSMQIFMSQNAQTFYAARGEIVALRFDNGIKDRVFPFVSSVAFIEPYNPPVKLSPN